MLLLIYVLLSLYMALSALSYPVYQKVSLLIQSRQIPDYQDIYLLSGFSLNLLLTLTITLFLKFHVKLVLSNSTTIDNMDKKNASKPNLYDKGSKLNWYQVFGKNKCLWFLPITGVSGKPIGDGVIWTQENNNEEEAPSNEVEARKSMPNQDNNRNRVAGIDPRPLNDHETKPSNDSIRKNIMSLSK